VLIDTQWVTDHLKDSEKVRIAEVYYDPRSNYSLGHIPGAVLFDWKQDINDPVHRNVLSKQACEELLQRAGLNKNTTLILYGDFNNWFAAFAFWVFKYYGYDDVRLMNGGRKKWLLEDRPVSKEIPQYAKGNFKALDADNSIRVFMNYVKESLEKVRKANSLMGGDTLLIACYLLYSLPSM
jgi:thiosulfate/3-mercaptopyruvate sulfurtransferase